MSGVMKNLKTGRKYGLYHHKALSNQKKVKYLSGFFFSVYFLIHFGFARAGLLAETKIKTVY